MCKKNLVSLLGIIPAGAGLTGEMERKGSTTRDHPRGCGAHLPHRSLMPYGVGSSPRVRGSLFLANPDDEAVGIIPAGAGLTLMTIRHSP